jgi:hypothetical protein
MTSPGAKILFGGIGSFGIVLVSGVIILVSNVFNRVANNKYVWPLFINTVVAFLVGVYAGVCVRLILWYPRHVGMLRWSESLCRL